VSFRLDDSMAMIPSRRLSQSTRSSSKHVFSKSGQATPAPGDLYVTSAVLKPSERKKIALVINREIAENSHACAATQLDDGAVAAEPRPVPAPSPAARTSPARPATPPGTPPPQAAPAQQTATASCEKDQAPADPTGIFTIVATVLLILGWYLPTDRYNHPKAGTRLLARHRGRQHDAAVVSLFRAQALPLAQFPRAHVGWFRFHMSLGFSGRCASSITRTSPPAPPTATWRSSVC